MNVARLSLITAAVAGTLSMTAQAETPTLGDVLKASGVTFTGYVDTSYSYLSGQGVFFNPVPAPGAATAVANRVFDYDRNSFMLNMVDVSATYAGSNGFGAFVQLNFGEDADTIDFVSPGANAADNFTVQEANLSYTKGMLSASFGKFATFAGAEVIESPANLNFSRGILFGYAIPFTHTGVRVGFAPNDKMKFTVGLNNGWDVQNEAAQATAADGSRSDNKTVELQAALTPVKNLSAYINVYSGKESATFATAGQRDLLDVVVSYAVTDALSVMLNVDYAKQKSAVAVAGGFADIKWQGVAAYVGYKLNSQWRVAGRIEEFDDKNGMRTGVRPGVAGVTGQKWKELTATVAFMPSDQVELRGEVRSDKSNVSAFTKTGSGGAFGSKSQNSVGVEAIYKF